MKELVRLFVFSAFCLALILILWDRPVILTGGLIVLSAALLIAWHRLSDIFVYIAAVGIGLVADWYCAGSIYQYGSGNVLQVPSWMPFSWGVIFLLFHRTTRLVAPRVRDEAWGRLLPVKRVIVAGIKIFILAYFWLSISIIDRNLAATAATLMVLTAYFWRSDADLIIFLIAGLAGTVGEILAIRLGIWTYSIYYYKPLHLPVSIPILWGLAGVLVGRAGMLGVRLRR